MSDDGAIVELTRRRTPPGKTTLAYLMHGADRTIDVGRGELDAVKRLAAWWGVPVRTRALGYGGYRVGLAPAPSGGEARP